MSANDPLQYAHRRLPLALDRPALETLIVAAHRDIVARLRAGE